jgi:hypothetical protein
MTWICDLSLPSYLLVLSCVALWECLVAHSRTLHLRADLHPLFFQAQRSKSVGEYDILFIVFVPIGRLGLRFEPDRTAECIKGLLQSIDECFVRGITLLHFWVICSTTIELLIS